MSEIHPTIPLRDLQKHAHHGIIPRLCTFILERFYDTKPYVEVPEALAHISDAQFALTPRLTALVEKGIMTSLETDYRNFSDEPFQHTARAKPAGYGGDFFSVDGAIIKAVSENVERFLWERNNSFYRNQLRYASYHELVPDALNPNDVVGFSETQRREHELEFNEHTTFGWIPADNLLDGGTTYCPLQLISRRYCTEERSPHEPLLRWHITTGLATAQTETEARLKGMLEIIERDAFMITYLNKLTPPQVDLRTVASPRVHTLCRTLERYRLEPHFVILPTDFPVYVILCVLVDRTGKGPLITVGARASFDINNSIIDALSEAHRGRFGHKQAYTAPLDTTRIGKRERTRIWATMKDTSEIDFLITGEPTTPQALPRSGNITDQYQTLVQTLREKKYRCFGKEITPRDIQQLGFRSVMVVIPELQPLHLDESIPYISGTRLKSVPKALGYTPAETLNPTPHPFP